MDVAGIIAELRSVLKGIEAGIRFLEQYPPGANAPETAVSALAIETQRTQISGTSAAPRRKKKCRRAGANG